MSKEALGPHDNKNTNIDILDKEIYRKVENEMKIRRKRFRIIKGPVHYRKVRQSKPL